MNDYISRVKLEHWLLNESACLDTEADKVCVVERLREDIPPANVRPVVRGSWEPYEFEIRPYIHGKPMWAQCSVCRKATRCREEPYTSSYTDETIIVERILNFCPNCGADMRPEQRKEEK